jgi:hypothetical protein
MFFLNLFIEKYLTIFDFLSKVFIKCDELAVCVTGSQQIITYPKAGGTSRTPRVTARIILKMISRGSGNMRLTYAPVLRTRINFNLPLHFRFLRLPENDPPKQAGGFV